MVFATLADSHRLQREGIVATLERLSFNIGDSVAVKIVHSPDGNTKSQGNDRLPVEQAEEEEVEEVGFTEINENAKAISVQLYSRFGVRKNEAVLLVCPDDSAAAQITAIMACVRIGAVFVPVDQSWLDTPKFKFLCEDTKAAVAIAVAETDTDAVITKLSIEGIHKVVYLRYNGER